MYWEDYSGEKYILFPEIIHTAKRKEPTCCECGNKISLGQQYLCFAGMWRSIIRHGGKHYPGGWYFKGYLMCFKCNYDWQKIISVFHTNGKKEARVIYGLLREAVRDALDEGFLKASDVLVQRWLPGIFVNNETEAEIWARIRADAVEKGTQPVLPIPGLN